MSPRRASSTEMIRIEPLLAVLPAEWQAAARNRGVSPRQVSTWAQAIRRAERSGWISLYKADEICQRLLKLHPLLVWSSEWLATDDSQIDDPQEVPEASGIGSRP